MGKASPVPQRSSSCSDCEPFMSHSWLLTNKKPSEIWSSAGLRNQRINLAVYTVCKFHEDGEGFVNTGDEAPWWNRLRSSVSVLPCLLQDVWRTVLTEYTTINGSKIRRAEVQTRIHMYTYKWWNIWIHVYIQTYIYIYLSLSIYICTYIYIIQ